MQGPLFSNYSVLQDGIKCPALSRKRVQVGSRLGLVVDTDRSLHLYADGKDQGVVARHIPNPCYFMFDLFNYCTKVFTVSLFLYYFSSLLLFLLLSLLLFHVNSISYFAAT